MVFKREYLLKYSDWEFTLICIMKMYMNFNKRVGDGPPAMKYSVEFPNKIIVSVNKLMKVLFVFFL